MDLDRPDLGRLRARTRRPPGLGLWALAYKFTIYVRNCASSPTSGIGTVRMPTSVLAAMRLLALLAITGGADEHDDDKPKNYLSTGSGSPPPRRACP